MIGSGPHIAARERIKSTLYDLAETVQMAYKSKFESMLKDDDSTVIVEGDPLEVIRGYSGSHDLIIMGKRTPPPSMAEGYSLSEHLASEGVLPLLVVQSEMRRCSQLRLIGGAPTPDRACVSSVLDLADRAHLAKKFSYFGPSAEFDTWVDLLADDIPSSSTTVHFTDVRHPLRDWQYQMDISKESLPVFFTKKNPIGRSGLCDADVSALLLDLPVAAALIWPVEFSAARLISSQSR